MRSDNGRQFEATLVREYFTKRNGAREFNLPATPEQNTYIEAYHSIIQRAVCDKMCFDSLKDGQAEFGRFRDFYNFERLHSGVGYITPVERLHELHIDIVIPPGSARTGPQFFIQQLSKS